MDKCLLALAIILSFLCFSSCEKGELIIEPPLRFSDDTIHFDTVFTSLGSTTRELRVINISGRKTRIDEIFLSGGESSSFRINIDGEPASRKSDITIESGDSIFIFIDVLIDPGNSATPVAVTDSIIFRSQGLLMKVQLLAWGQDIVLLKSSVIESETWQGTKPYVIYGTVIVDTLHTLTVEPGVRICFHWNSSLVIAGSLDARGTFEKPVQFTGDRLEKEYEDVPGQWNGIFFLSSSIGNKISHSVIRNSVYGINLGEPEAGVPGPDLKLFFSEVSHHSVNGLSAINAVVVAANSLFSHTGRHCISISSGGEYSFTHCTISNQWDYGLRLTPSVMISEKPVLPAGAVSQLNLDLNNCVVYGDLISEIDIIPSGNHLAGNYFFDHCLLKLDTVSSPFWARAIFPGVQINKNPRFIEPFKYDFRPDTLSPLIDRGNDIYLAEYPVDLRNVSRLDYGKPDLGAYERIPGEGKENNK